MVTGLAKKGTMVRVRGSAEGSEPPVKLTEKDPHWLMAEKCTEVKFAKTTCAKASSTISAAAAYMALEKKRQQRRRRKEKKKRTKGESLSRPQVIEGRGKEAVTSQGDR